MERKKQLVPIQPRTLIVEDCVLDVDDSCSKIFERGPRIRGIGTPEILSDNILNNEIDDEGENPEPVMKFRKRNTSSFGGLRL